ncbi:MAG: nickel pincer cofactor biosynthesis protein LarC, partial [Polyangia bacterium]
MSKDLRGSELYFDCFSGIAGDMTLGALLDLGVPEAAVRTELEKLPLKNYRLTRGRVRRGALMGTKIQVLVDEEHHEHHHHGDAHHDPRHSHAAHHHHTHYRDIKAMLQQHLGGEVLKRSLAIFDRIAAVEARLHGVTVEDVAFHEVGAVDSIVDIVGAAAALAWLAPSRITSRRVPLGGGTVDTAHGRLPVPAPATLELLAGAEVEAGGDSELTTPTGAGILAASVAGYGVMPPLRVLGVGWGAGDRALADRPNLLRVVAGARADLGDASNDEIS